MPVNNAEWRHYFYKKGYNVNIPLKKFAFSKWITVSITFLWCLKSTGHVRKSIVTAFFLKCQYL